MHGEERLERRLLDQRFERYRRSVGKPVAQQILERIGRVDVMRAVRVNEVLRLGFRLIVSEDDDGCRARNALQIFVQPSTAAVSGTAGFMIKLYAAISADGSVAGAIGL
jgi:hypothetical protein